MGEQVRVLIGTRKGAFVAESDGARKAWKLRGPFCDASTVNHVVADAKTGTIWAGGGNAWFGPAVWKSTDLGETWTRHTTGLAYPEGHAPIAGVWSLAARGNRLYAGVEPAGLFQSDDGGETWTHVEGLQKHPSRPEWQPGGAGLILHSIVTHPNDDEQIWIGISAVGVFHTADGGKTWETRNRGTRNDYMPDDQKYPEFGQCVHSIAIAPGISDRLYQQNHCGMYRSDDGGKSWRSIEKGLPSSFGFPSATHPRDADTLYYIPLNGDSVGRFVPEGKAAVWRSRDGGSSWKDLRAGLPQENAFFGVLRQGMATDKMSPAGVYFGTSSGAVFASSDEGESWSEIARHLPTVTSIETMVAA